MAKGDWTKERDEIGFIHWLDTGVEDHLLKVEKSAGGDYFVTAYREGDVAGGEVDYADDLRKCKTLAEKYLNENTWRELLPE